MIQLTRDKMQKAIERAKQNRPFVMPVGEREYHVESAHNLKVYEVRFAVKGREKFGECNCKGGQAGLVCYHLAGAAAVHIGLARQRRMYAQGAGN